MTDKAISTYIHQLTNKCVRLYFGPSAYMNIFLYLDKGTY